MANGAKKERTPRSEGATLSTWILFLIPLLAALFYGVVGKDKFLLLSPLAILGWFCLSAWMARVAVSRRLASVAPSGFYFFLLYVLYGVAIGVSAQIPYEAKLRMLAVGLPVGAYYLWANSLVLFRTSRTVLGWLILFALLLSFYGLVNHFKHPLQVLWVERYAPYVGRLASTYICPNHFAHLLQMLLPFCLVLVFIPQAGAFLRVLAGYSFVMFLPTLFLTESRAGWLGSIVGVGVTLCLLALRRSKLLFLLLVILIPLGSALLLLAGWQFSETFQRRMAPVVQFLEGQAEEGVGSEAKDFRPQTWMDTIDMIKERPVTGFGPGSYRYLFPEHRKRCTAVRVVTGHPHNEYLEISSEYGLVGFGLFALAWCWGLVRLLVFSLKTPEPHHAFIGMAFLGTAAGTMVHSFFDFEMHVFQNALVFALLAAIAAGPMCGRRQEALLREGKKGAQNLWLRLVRAGLALLAVAGLAVALPTYSSAFFRSEADRLAEKGKPELAKRYYERAIRIDPANWRAYLGMGAVYHKQWYYTLEPEEKRKWAEAERNYFSEGYARNPKDPLLVSAYGQTLVFLGEKDRGIGLLRQAADLRPFNDHYWWLLGVELRKAGRYEESLEVFRYARTVRNTPSIRANIQWLERQLQPAAEKKKKPSPAEKPIMDTRLKRPKESIPLDNLFQQMEGAQ